MKNKHGFIILLIYNKSKIWLFKYMKKKIKNYFNDGLLINQTNIVFS